MTAGNVSAPEVEARRALVLHDRPLVVDLIQLTLNHGLFVVRAARSLAEADAILAEWRPDMTVIDMDHDDSTALLGRLGASNSLTRSVTPVLGLTRRGDLKTKLRAFDLGVDDILTMPFSPEELLARSIVITRRATGTDRPIIPTIRIGEIEIDILNRQVRAGQSVVHLSGIEQSLLYLLASRGGRVVTREEILDSRPHQSLVSRGLATKRSFTTDEARALAIELGIDFEALGCDLEQFRMGLGVELEHGPRDPETDVSGNDPIVTGKIALAHLTEFPDYYTRLAVMEREAADHLRALK